MLTAFNMLDGERSDPVLNLPFSVIKRHTNERGFGPSIAHMITEFDGMMTTRRRDAGRIKKDDDTEDAGPVTQTAADRFFAANPDRVITEDG